MLVGYSYDLVIPNFNKSEVARVENNDCVVRSIASAYEISYDEAHRICEEKFNRKDNDGVFNTKGKFEKLKNENWIYNNKKINIIDSNQIEYNGSARFQKKYTDLGLNPPKIRMTVKMITEKFNEGRYILIVRDHAFTLIDGIIYGNFMDRRKKRVKVQYLIKIEEVDN